MATETADEKETMSERVRLIMPTRTKIGGRDVDLPDGLKATVSGHNGELVTILVEIQVPRDHVRTIDFREGAHE
jgi:hypothetical protein